MSDKRRKRAPEPEEPESPASEESLESLDAEALRDRWLRAAADLDNLRKRTAREIEAARRHERADILSQFLHVLDSLERAIGAEGDQGDESVEGLRAIHAQMLGVFRQFGAEPFDASQEMFDPDRHEAVATLADPSQPNGTIVDVVQTGHRMADGTILRAARVTVVRNS